MNIKTFGILLGLSAMLIAGCKTSTPTQAIIKSEGVLITTVDIGMKTWSIYINKHVSDGKVTQAQINTVHKAYDDYYAAQIVTEGALSALITSGSTNATDIVVANGNVVKAETVLLGLLNQYIIK